MAITGRNDAIRYAQSVAKRYRIRPEIFLRQLNQESGFQTQARSPMGAQGIGQIMPGTARDLARQMGVSVQDVLYDPETNIEAAALYFRQQLDRFGGDYRMALAAYNAGPGAVEQHGGVPPYMETQTYVRNILGDDEDPVEDPDDPGAPFPEDEPEPEEPDPFADDEPEPIEEPTENPDDPFAGGAGGEETVGDLNPGLHPDNRYRDYPASTYNIQRANAVEDQLRSEARSTARSRQAADEAEARIRSRPRTPGTGPAPLNRLPASAFSPGNPSAGIDDQMARAWEREHGFLKSSSTRGGTLTDILARLRGTTPGDRPADLNSSPEFKPLSGRFTAPPRGGSANDLMKTSRGFSDVDQRESSYYLPFGVEELGGDQRAVNNVLTSAGFDTNVGNPYTQHLQSMGPKLAQQSTIARALKGEEYDERGVAGDVLGALTAGKTRIFTPETLRSELSALKGRPDLTPSQLAVVAAFETDPRFATSVIEGSSKLAPDLERYRNRAYDRRYEDFLNKAPASPQSGLFDFLFQGYQ